MNQKKMSIKTKCCAVFLLAGLFPAIFGIISVHAEMPEKMPALVGKTLPEAKTLLQEAGHEYAWSIEDIR